MKCVECGQPISKLWEEPVKGNITLTICSSCNKIADKFIEYDYTLIFLNLILSKTQVYRHILFNINFCKTFVDLCNMFFLSCFADTILSSCEDLECWTVEYSKNILKNLCYLGVIVAAAKLSGTKVKKRSIVRAVLFASFGKLGTFMIVIWNYSYLHRGMMSFFIFLNNIIAVKEVLETSFFKSFSYIFLAIVVSSIEGTLRYYGLVNC